MSDFDRHGRSEAVPAVLLPAVEFDAADGRPAAPGIGVSVPWEVIALPGLEFNAADPADAARPPRAGELPPLVLTVRPPAGLGVEQVTAELQPLFAALREYEAGLGGKGLQFDPVDAPAGAVAWRVSAVDPAGAGDRLRALADVLTRPNPSRVKQAADRLADRFPLTAAAA